jgi:hypothetical protein
LTSRRKEGGIPVGNSEECRELRTALARLREVTSSSEQRARFCENPRDMLGSEVFDALPEDARNALARLDEKEVALVARLVDTLDDYGMVFPRNGTVCIL